MNHPPQHPSPYPVPSARQPSHERGYRWSGALALAAVLLFGLSLLLNSNPIKLSPAITEEFTSDDMIELEVAEGEADAWALFTSGEDKGTCMYYPPSGDLSIPRTWYLNADGYGDWDTLGNLDTSEPGLYRITCADSANDFALASAGTLHAVKAQLFVTGVIVFFVAPSVLLAAIVVGVVTALRRRSARTRPSSQAAQQSPHQI
ncbi:hypothetical protein [Nocardiopsis sp. B62]|uniref:hypothetical protein n=1 Tax=Nocardiopsis sp. B62 TaxID=2824874 RepID=UPI001B3819A7|nr:hypothetical protein [Nocardiopsis sp. B62]MBQ1080106.1 hypothetical protein [Nocardiopsis sp. B62]